MHANTPNSEKAGRARALTGRAARRRRVVAALVAVGVVAAGCSSGSDGATGEPGPTFSRARGSSLQFQEPVATVSELMPPATGDDAWTIVGSVFDPAQGTSMATTWASPDGVTWDRSEQAPADSDVSEAFSAITTTDDGRVAVGWVGDGAASDAAVWREGDGGWTRVDAPDMAGEHEQWAFDVAANGSGIVVAGGENVWGEVRPRLWFSADGETWRAVDGGPGGPFDASGQESVREVAAVGDGFVAVGSRNLDSEQDGVVWYSADGETWEQLDAPTLGGAGRQALLSVTSVGDVVVAGGYATDLSGQGKPVVWRSTDGRTWGQPSAPLAIHEDTRNAAADLAVRSLSVDDQGALVAGGGNDWTPQVWRSGDAGVTWTLLPNPVGRGLFLDGVAIDGVATRGDTTVALGLEPTVMRLRGDRWQDATGDAFPNGGVQPFAASVAVGDDATVVAGGRYSAPQGDTRERYVGMVWLQDGGQWQPVETDYLNAGQIMDITPYAGGFAAVGFEDFGLAKKRTAGDSSPDGLIWTSPDGRAWQRVAAEAPRIDDELLPIIAENPSEDTAAVVAEVEAEQPRQTKAPAGGVGTRSLEAVAPLGDGFIAVGVAYNESQVEPIVVVSADGTDIQGEDPAFGGPGIQRFRDICVADDGTAIAVGAGGTDSDLDVAVRLRDAAGRWSRGTADDGTFSGDGNQQAYGCAAGDDGFVLVGADDASGDSDARVWTSDDGLTWERVESGTLGGAGDQWSSAVAAVPDDGGWLVGGTDTAGGDSDIALWRVTAGGDVSRRDEGEDELSGPGEQSVSNLVVDD
ncbi:MAG TPA: hypothetical protein VF743_13315, partial [Acidimicrobiales bacterium]